MALHDLLISFDRPPPQPAGPSAAWLDGHAAGLAQGRAEAQADQDRLSRDLAEAIADLAFTYRDAEAHVLARIAPLLTLIAERILPMTLQAGFAPMLAERLQQALRDELAAGLSLAVAPADFDALTRFLQGAGSGGLRPVADPRLSAGQAVIATARGAAAFDINLYSRDLAAALAAVGAPSPQRQESHV